MMKGLAKVLYILLFVVSFSVRLWLVNAQLTYKFPLLRFRQHNRRFLRGSYQPNHLVFVFIQIHLENIATRSNIIIISGDTLDVISDVTATKVNIAQIFSRERYPFPIYNLFELAICQTGIPG